MKRLRVGLTGGIGSGKSAAAAELARLGATVIDTDAIAHELSCPGGAAIGPIRREFGEAFIDASGALERSRMRERVFSDPEARQKLEALLHPMIREESERRAAAATGDYVVLVVPLLIESGDYRRRVDRVLVIDCPEEMQIARVQRRSGLSRESVLAIMRSQVPRETRNGAADDLIDNSGTLDALHHRLGDLHRKYLKLAQG